MKIGNKDFETEHSVYIMGILNVTPDSFSDGGNFNTVDSALKQAEKMIGEGASIIDVGGESTRPGFMEISAEEEISRVAPVIEAIHSRFDIPVSIDTYKSAVAEAAIGAGAAMVNDIWGLKADPKIAGLIARNNIACCLMHNRKQNKPENQKPENYRTSNLMEEMLSDLKESLTIAEEAGIPGEKIILDPGIGFAKTYEDNLAVLRELDRLKELGCPILLGASRKSVIGLTLDLPIEERLEGTLATTAIGVMKGASFLRVHDVKENLRSAQMALAIRG